MVVIVDCGVVLLLEHEAEGLIVDHLLEFGEMKLVVGLVRLETELEVLIVEDADVGLGVVLEELDHPGGVLEVLLEKRGED